jgi:hypothetical protein
MMDLNIFPIIGGLAIILCIPILIYYICFMCKVYKPREQTNNTRIQVYETNVMPTSLGSSRPANNIIYPEQVDPAPEYSPPDESSHVIPIPHSEPNPIRTQIPSESQEPIDRPPTYRV